MSVDIFGLVRRTKGWWTKKSDLEKQAKLKIAGRAIAVAGLAASLISLIPIFNEFRASPEEKLVKLGYKKTHEDFWRAVVNKHPEAVALFAQARVPLEPRDFVRLFDDRVFNVEVFESLVRGNSLRETYCPTDVKGLMLYKSVAGNQEKVRAIRRVCNKSTVIDSIKATRTAEQARLAEAAARDRGRTERVKECSAKYQAEGDRRLIAEASQFNILGPVTYTERQCILAHLNRELLLGARALVNSDRVFRTIIRQCCEQYDPPQPPNDAGLRAADDAIALLERT